MVLLLLVSIAAWQENLGNNGPPLPLSQGVFGVAFSPDGRTVAVINPSLEMWSVADPAHPRRLGYSKGDIVTGADPAFSPDGSILASASADGTVVLRNVAGAALAFSASGHTLTAIAGSSSVTVWNVTGTGGLARVTPSRLAASAADPWRSPPAGMRWPGRPPPATRSPYGPCPDPPTPAPRLAGRARPPGAANVPRRSALTGEKTERSLSVTGHYPAASGPAT